MAQPNPFAIQLRRLGISEISLKSTGFPGPGKIISDKMGIQTGVGQYDAKAKSIHVFLTALTPLEKSEEINSLKLTLVGEFHVEDESKLPFPIEKITDWAGSNGVTVMLPFLREHIHAITQRAGFTGSLFPLLEINRFKVGTPDSPAPNVSFAKPAEEASTR